MFNIFQQSAVTKRSSLGKMIDQSTALLMVAIGSLILLLALMILFHENANATKGYRLRTLEHERNQLLLEEEVLMMQIAQQQALEQLQEDPRVKAMIEPRSPLYIRGDQAVRAEMEN